MSLSQLFNPLKKRTILVAGDFMMDSYTKGSVKRVSPEAPVIVVNAKEQMSLPGGAGNVVLNLISLGASVRALGRLGNDDVKESLLKHLETENVDAAFIYSQQNYQTPIKNRVIAGNQQIVRVDFEENTPLSSKLEQQILGDLPQILKDVSVVAISDYAKGFLTEKIIAELIRHAKDLDIPVIVDPKGVDFKKYSGAFLIKPNSKEAYLASGYDDYLPLEKAAQKIYHETKIKNIMITRSDKGISLFQEGARRDFSVKVKEVRDVTGAGDTVLAVLTFAISNGVSVDQAAVLCNLAAAEVIEHLGCARISIKTLAELILNQNLDNKVFSQSYQQVLQFVLDYEDFILVKMSMDSCLTPNFFAQLKQLKHNHEKCKLVLYVENELKDKALIELLASLDEIDFIISQIDNLQLFCERHVPKKIYHFNNDQLTSHKSLERLLSATRE